MTKVQKQLILFAVLALVVAGLAVYAYLVEHVGGEEQARADQHSQRVMPFARDTASEIRLTRAGTTIVLRKESDVTAGNEQRWRLVEPIQSAADAGTVNTLLERLAALEHRRAIEADEPALASYGLDDPELIAVVNAQGETPDGTPSGGASTFTLLVGKQSGFDNSRFVRSADSNSIMVVDNAFFPAVNKDLFALREKRLMRFETNEVRELRVTAGEVAYALQKEGDGWRLSEPVNYPADKATVESLLSALRNLKARSFVAEEISDPSRYGFNAPDARAVVVSEQGGSHELLIGHAAGGDEHFARSAASQAVAKVEQKIVDDLVKQPDQLRDKKLFTFDRDAVHQIVVEIDGSESMALQRRDETASEEDDPSATEETWELVRPRQANAKKWKVRSLVSRLEYLKADSFVEAEPTELAPYGLDAPQQRLRLLDETGSILAELRVGDAANDEEYFVQTSARPAVFRLQKSRLDDLASKPEDVAEALPMESTSGANPAPE
jgi:hypothetical protein